MHDPNNRSQIELLIRPVLELYLLAHSLFYEEPILFSFGNTSLKTNDINFPTDITPLEVIAEPAELMQLYMNQELIWQGRAVSHVPSEGPLQAEQDLSHQRFTLVKPSGYGSISHPLYSPEQNQIVFSEIQNTFSSFHKNRVNRSIIKALDFIRRALSLGKMGFYNEAYLNYFRVIEAFTNTNNADQLSEYLQITFSLTKEEAIALNETRNNVVAHGNMRQGYLREVGQMELYKLKECAFAILEVYLIA